MTGFGFEVAMPNAREGTLVPPGKGFARLDSLAAIARTAETAGLDGLWVSDHLVAHAAGPDEAPNEMLESLMVLTYLAQVTERVRLGTGVLALPLRDPVLLARQLIVLDHLSSGRTVLGVGIGLPAEVRLIRPTASKLHRWRSTVEASKLIRRLLDGEIVESTVPYNEFGAVQMNPGPVQSRLPIHVATTVAGNLADISDFADGWHVRNKTPAELRHGIELIGQSMTAAGRQHEPVEAMPYFHLRFGADPQSAAAAARAMSPQTRRDDTLNSPTELLGTPDQVAERLIGYAAAGATSACISFFAESVPDMQDQIARFGADVIPLVRSAL